MTPYIVVTVDHRPGGKTTYGLAITTNGIDRQPVAGRSFTRPIEAVRDAERLQRRLDKEKT